MNYLPIPANTLAEPEVLTIPIDKILTQVREERQVIVHCRIDLFPGDMVRIWRTTFLRCGDDGTRIPLAHAENISFAPQWTMVPDFCIYRFTLIFNGLPSNCTYFDLVEEVEESGSFHAKDIARNQTDVYQIWL